MKKFGSLLLALALLLSPQAYAGELRGIIPTGVAIPSGAGTNGAPNCAGYGSVLACETAMGYADPRLHGAIFDYSTNGTAHDLSTVIDADKTATVTISIATPGVVTWTAHALVANTPVQFTTSGALPSGLQTGVTYYVVGSSITTNTFQVAAAAGGSAIGTSGSQSGTQTAIGINGIQGDGVPIFFPGNGNINTTLQVLTPNQTWFGPERQPMYSKFGASGTFGSPPVQPFLHVNTGNIQSGPENCMIESNVHQGFTRRSMTFYGDGSQTSGLCFNANTNNADGSQQAPIVDDRDVSTMNMGNFIGCPSNPAGGAPTGTLCGNVYLYRGDNIISAYNQNDFTGNGSDARVRNFVFAATTCASVWLDQSSGPPSGNWIGGRIEGQGGTFCPDGVGEDAFHVNGSRWNMYGIQIESWTGSAYVFEGNYSKPTIVGGFIHNVGTGKVANHQAAFNFNGSNAGVNNDARIYDVTVLADNASPDTSHNNTSVFNFQGGNDSNMDISGVSGGSTAYAPGGSYTSGTVPSTANIVSADEVGSSQLSLNQIAANAYYVGALGSGNYVANASGNISFIDGFVYAFTAGAVGSSQNWPQTTTAAAGNPAVIHYGVHANSTNVITQIDGAGTGGGQLQGTSTNDGAVAGIVGEYISSNIASGSAVALTTGTSKNVTTISLTAGDWNVCGNVAFTAAGTTTATSFLGGISTTTNTLPTPPGAGAYFQLGVSVGAGGTEPATSIGCARETLAATTTIYLVAQSNFAISTMSAYGFIGARRMR